MLGGHNARVFELPARRTNVRRRSRRRWTLTLPTGLRCSVCARHRGQLVGPKIVICQRCEELPARLARRPTAATRIWRVGPSVQAEMRALASLEAKFVVTADLGLAFREMGLRVSALAYSVLAYERADDWASDVELVREGAVTDDQLARLRSLRALRLLLHPALLRPDAFRVLRRIRNRALGGAPYAGTGGTTFTR
jgi:hypothetical protein